MSSMGDIHILGTASVPRSLTALLTFHRLDGVLGEVEGEARPYVVSAGAS